MKAVSFKEIVEGLRAFGLDFLDARTGGDRAPDLPALSRALLDMKGEAAAVALAGELIAAYRQADRDARKAYFTFLVEQLSPDPDRVQLAIDSYNEDPSPATLYALSEVTEAPRQGLFRAINMAEGGTAAIVAMRADLLALLPEHPDFVVIDADMRHLLASWFNRGFLQLRRISWETPALILEKLIDYESVHEIQGWEDLRRRLADDRRCYAFFHPALGDEPLIFVEVALTRELSGSIGTLLEAETLDGPVAANTAIFYSINNCQDGLRGISFGNFLIKQVVERLSEELPQLKTFSTLSPIPGFLRWLKRELDEPQSGLFDAAETDLLQSMLDQEWPQDQELCAALEPVLMRACAHYLIREKRRDLPLDPVARFHLRNGARIERLNWLGDRSENGLHQSAGLLVNYLYDRKTVAANHEAYVNQGRIAIAPAVSRLLNTERSLRSPKTETIQK